MGSSKKVDLTFNPSNGHTIGMEVEVQILDRETGELAPGAVSILKSCQNEGIPNVCAEFKQSMIEIKTGICSNVTEARNQIFSLARKVRNVANSLGYEIALSGTHPFSKPQSSAVFPGARYEKIQDRLGWIASQDLIFGLHVHVGVESGDMAIALMNTLVPYLPHMLALSVNSPFWQGVDTGLETFRTAMYRMLPQSGVPPHFRAWKDFKKYMLVMLDAGGLESLKDIYWDIRPRPDFGTIEIRIFDVPPTLTSALALVALTRSLVIANERLLKEKPELSRGDVRNQWVAQSNKWLATRYGLDGMYLRTPAGKRRALSHEVKELVEKLMPIARESGDDRFLAEFRSIENFETGSQRQRRLYREQGSWRALTDDMVSRLALDIGLASPQRPLLEGGSAAI